MTMNMAGGKPGRQFSQNGMAISHALKSSLEDMKRVALRHVHVAIVKHEGSSGRIAEELGVALSTYQNWVAKIPEVAELHLRYRPDRMPGPVPRLLVEVEAAKARDAVTKPSRNRKRG